MTGKKRRGRFLPKYVSAFEDRHGRTRYRYRRTGFEGGYFKAELGTEQFREEYRAFGDGQIDPDQPKQRVKAGTVDDLFTRFVSVPARLGPTEETQKKVRAVLGWFRERYGTAYVADIEFSHIDAILELRREKVLVEKRMHGGVEAARKLRKELVRLFDFAEKSRMIMPGSNPAKHAEKVKTAPGQRTKGFYSWTEEDIAKYRKCHPIGSRARLALELLLWTGQRRGDGYLFGPDDLKDGLFQIVQGKTGKELWIPLAPPLEAAIKAMPEPPEGVKAFLLSEWGKPYSYASFGNKMRDWCDDAGLPQCTAHGLRKANARRMAELEMNNSMLKSIGGWSNDREVGIYTAAADQARLAKQAIARLTEWEEQFLKDANV